MDWPIKEKTLNSQRLPLERMTHLPEDYPAERERERGKGRERETEKGREKGEGHKLYIYFALYKCTAPYQLYKSQHTCQYRKGTIHPYGSA